tara:strand:+ start:412 stop:849 length:438 start_codon:yes stop_codon:yes gene_type:complete
MIAKMEKFADVSAEAVVLIGKHWSELYGNGNLKSDLGGMIELERTGNFAYFTLRTETGELAGHAGFMVFRSPFYGAMQALDVFYYVLPDHRGGLGICKLLKLSGQMLKVNGVSQIMISHKKNQNLGVLLERANYEPSGETYEFKE